MTNDAHGPDTEELFNRFLAGRQPRPLEEVKQRMAASAQPAPKKLRRPRRAGLVAIAAAVLVVTAVAAVALYGHNNRDSLRTATNSSSSVASTISTSLPADAPACGPEELPPGQMQAYIPGSYPDKRITSHFGDRFNSIWNGAYVPKLDNDQRVMIAATQITDADRAWAASVPVVDGHIQLVDAKYSLAQLKVFAARLKTKIPEWRLPKKYSHYQEHQTVQDLLSSTTVTFPPIPHSVYPKGLYNVTTGSGRLDGSDNFGEKVVTVVVIKCSTPLRAQLVSIANSVNVPLDALHIQSVGYP